LWEWLQQRPELPARATVFAAVAQAIRHMHDAGIFHADLNLTNLLVRTDTTSPDVRIIDFDRGRVYPQPLSHSQREKNLRRLRRSWRKLDQTIGHSYT
jgi:3-deoxy-D-manno-octulosonic acid kinase